MESPESLSTPSLATVFFDKFEKDELQELLKTKPLDWLFAQNASNIDEKASEFGSGLLTNITNPTQENLSNYILLVEKERKEGKKKEESFDLREIQQMIRELTIGIVVFDQLPGVYLRPKFDQGTFVDIPPAYINTHVAQCMIELDYYMKCLWHGAHFGRERRQKFTERWIDLMNVNKEGIPETRVDKQAIFKDYGLYDFNKDSNWHEYYEREENEEDVQSCRKLSQEILDSIGLYLLCSIEEAQQHRNMLVFSIRHDISSFTRKGLDDLMDDTHQPLTCWLQSQRSAVREWFTKKPKVRQLLAKVKFITALSYFLISMKKFSMVPDVTSYLPQLTTEQVKTEDTLPPLMLPSEVKTSNPLFSNNNMYCHIHGSLVLGKEKITLKPASDDLVKNYDTICDIAVQQNHKKLKGSGDGNLYPMAEVDIDNKTYAMVAIELEKYLVQSPKSPRWLHTIIDGAEQTKKRVLPVSEQRVNDQFNRRFGTFQKLPTSNLELAILLGRSSVFEQTMKKSTKTRLIKCDENRMSMMHKSAMNDFPNLICDMVTSWSCDVNIRWESDNKLDYGPSPLHIAAKCGAIESTYCLLSFHAALNLVDDKGWLPIHSAAYHNQYLIMNLFLARKPSLIDQPTKNSEEASPLLLACSSGALDTVRKLLDLGAKPTSVTKSGRGVIHLAALNRHVNILELFIDKDYAELAVWDILVTMMNSKEQEEKYHAVLALDTLTRGGKNWSQILGANAIPALVNILKPDPMALLDDNNAQVLELKKRTSKVLNNVSIEDDIRRAIAATNSIKTFIGLLSLNHDEVQSNTAYILSDIGQVNDNAQKVAQEGGIVPLITLLKSYLPTVLTAAMCALCKLGENYAPNKEEIARKDGLEPLVQLLSNSDPKVQAAAAEALNVVARDSISNQNVIMSIGGIPHLVNLVQSNNIEVQVNAAGALRSLALSNTNSQERIADLGGINPLIRLLKSNPRNLDVQEKASGALWALSGNDPSKRRDIGTKIGIEMLIVLLESRSEKIQFVAAKALSTLSCGAPKHQTKIREAGGVLPLVRMLKQYASERVLIAVISTLAALSIGLAHTPVKQNQSAIASGGAIKPLVSLVTGASNDLVKVQSAYAIACIILAHTDNQKLLQKESSFNYTLLVDLLYSSDREVSLGAGRALTTFAYNNIPAQRDIVNGGEIQYEQFIQFLQTGENEDEQTHAAFQVVILARVMTGEDHVIVMAEGIKILSQRLQSHNELIQELAANCLASLAHTRAVTRAGIPAAIVTVGAMSTLIDLLSSPYELVRTSAATAIGYMTYNRDAMRILLTACRRSPGLFDMLLENVSGGKISDIFIKEWEYCVLVGLPSQSVKLTPVEHQVLAPSDQAQSQSTIIVPAKTITDTMETPTYGTISEEIIDSSSIHRYTSASSAVM